MSARVKKSSGQSGGKTPCKKLVRNQRIKRKISNKQEPTEIKQDTNQCLSRKQRMLYAVKRNKENKQPMPHTQKQKQKQKQKKQLN